MNRVGKMLQYDSKKKDKIPKCNLWCLTLTAKLAKDWWTAAPGPPLGIHRPGKQIPPNLDFHENKQ